MRVAATAVPDAPAALVAATAALAGAALAACGGGTDNAPLRSLDACARAPARGGGECVCAAFKLEQLIGEDGNRATIAPPTDRAAHQRAALHRSFCPSVEMDSLREEREWTWTGEEGWVGGEGT